MRVELEKLKGRTVSFIAVKENTGRQCFKTKEGNVFPTCLKFVRRVYNNELMTDHVWVKCSKLKNIPFGSTFTFTAKVVPYIKIYKGKEYIDYNLDYITNIKIIRKGESK